MKKTIFIIDAYNLIYRMFYAIPEMHTRDGRQVNAIFGVAKFLRALAEENPSASLLVTTDVGRSFREEIYSEYKAQRDRMPDNLRLQIDGVFDLFRAVGVSILSFEGYEADDVIGSIAHQHENNEYQVVIISSDKDLCQFVRDDHVHIYDAMKRKFLKRADVIEKFGIPPEQVRDYLAIVGDSSDNIPGISGFGPKKAVDLLSKYGSLENIYDHIDELTLKMKEVLIAERENAFLSQKLASIKTDLDIIPLPETPFAPGILSGTYIELLQKHEFRSLIPTGYHKEEERKITTIKSKSLNTIQELEKLRDRILQENIRQIAISTDAFGKIVIGISSEIYAIDSTKVDCKDFIDFIFSHEIDLIGYNLKTDLKRLHTIQKPAEAGIEEQGRLF